MKNHKLIKIKQEKCAKCCSGFRLILHSAHYFVNFLQSGLVLSSILLYSQIIFCLNHDFCVLMLFFRLFSVE